MSRGKNRAPGVRADGEMTPGNANPKGAGQPNGREPHAPIADATGPGRSTYGEAQALKQEIQDTPIPPGVHPVAHAARVAASRAGLINQKGQLAHPNVTPLFAPTERPWEPVTNGAPMAPGPTNPMAMPQAGDPGISIASILEQAAEASGSPELKALAARAQAIASPAPSGPLAA